MADKAIFAAAGGRGIGAVKKPSDVPQAAWDSAVKSAANKIISAYNQMDRVAPANVYELAGKEAPEQRSIELGDLYYQVDRWAMSQMHSIYFACLYMEDNGELYALFSKEGHLFRADVTIRNGEAQIGELQEVQKVYEPVSRFFVHRQANGDIRFAMIAATAVVNRVGQIDSTLLFDNMIRRAEETGYYPRLDFYHLGGVHPAFEFGQFDVLARDGVAYVASGLMDKDHPLTSVILRSMDDGASYGASIEYYPFENAIETLEVDGISIKVYTDGINTRISLLPEQQAASWFTTITTRSLDNMEKRQLEALRAAFGDEEELKKFLASIAGTNERAQGLIARALEGDAEDTTEEVTEEVTEEAAPPVLEIDDETIGLIAAEVVRQLGEGALATVNGAIEKLTKDVGKLTGNVDALAGVQRQISGRVDALEADEDDKRQTWLGDLPAARRTVTVTHRPRQERPAEETVKTGADVAAATLAGLPMPPGLKT
jgi:hypothetical protein